MKYFIKTNEDNTVMAFIETATPEFIPDIEQYQEISEQLAEEIKAHPNAKLSYFENEIEVIEKYQKAEPTKAVTVDDIAKKLEDKETTDIIYQTEMELNMLSLMDKITALEEKIKGE